MSTRSGPDPGSHAKPQREAGDRAYLGIDPGLTGALARVIVRSSGMALLDSLADMPVVSSGNRKRIDDIELSKLLKSMSVEGSICLEKVWGIKGQGAGAAFTFGEGYGVIKGVLATLALDYPSIYGGYETPSPRAWRAVMVPGEKGKEASILAAKRMLPSAEPYLKLKKHDGRADAILLAIYLARRKA